MRLVERILKDPQCYRRNVDDSCPSIEDFHVPDDLDFSAIVAREDGETVALFLIFHPVPAIGDVHFYVLPRAWGCSRAIVRAFLAWVWEKTSLTDLIGRIPAFNRLAYRVAIDCGFRDMRREPGAVVRRGVRYDMLITEIARPTCATS